MDLDKLVVLFLDLQTSGANPKKGRVLEVGWARSDFSRECGLDENSLHSYLLQQPEGCEIPERIQSITGISPDEIENHIRSMLCLAIFVT